MNGYRQFCHHIQNTNKHFFVEKNNSGTRLLSSIANSDNIRESFANDYKSDSKMLRQCDTSFLILRQLMNTNSIQNCVRIGLKMLQKHCSSMDPFAHRNIVSNMITNQDG